MVVLVLALAIPMAAAPVMAADASKLVGHWQFDGNANDRSGYANHGTLQDNASVSGGVLNLDGTNDYMSVGFSTSLDFTDPGQDFTVEAWVYCDVLKDYDLVFQQENNVDTGRSWLYVRANGALRSFIGGIATETDPGLITAENWYHIALTFDKDDASQVGTLKLYVDGNEKVSSTPTFEPSEGDYRVGIHKNDTHDFDGLIDEVRIWSEALPQSRLMDTSPPVVTITAPEDGMCYKSITGYGGSASDANIDASTAFEWTPSPLPITKEGIHTVYLTATDILGYSAQASVTFTIDSTLPVVTITAPEDGAFYLVGTVPAGAYDVDELNSYTVVESGWSDAAGMHTYIVTATDCAGNVGDDSVTYYVVDSYGTIGGQIIQEDGGKKKDWYKISYGGWAGLAGATEYGELEVTFHNVSDPNLADTGLKTRFESTSITYFFTKETPQDDEPADPPPSVHNKLVIEADGIVVNAKTGAVIYTGCKLRIDAADTGEPAQDGIPDSIRFQLDYQDDSAYDYDTNPEFTPDTETASRTTIDAGNIQVVVPPTE